MYRHHLLFGRKNFLLMLVGIGVILLGYLLMAGGASTDPNVYPEDVLYGFQRTVLAPVLCLIGFGIEIAAIFWRTSDEEIIYEPEKETPLPVSPRTTPVAPVPSVKPTPPKRK